MEHPHLVSLDDRGVAVHADPNSDLFKAASDGDLAGLRQALDQGAHVNSLDE